MMARESYRLANGGPVAGGGRDIMIRSGTYYDCLAQTLADDCRSEGDRDRGTLTRRFAQEVRCRNCRATQGGFEARSILTRDQNEHPITGNESVMARQRLAD